MRRGLIRGGILSAVMSTISFGATFTNGNFETGDATGWTIGGGARNSVANSAFDPQQYLPGGSRYNATIAGTHSSIVGPGFDPNTSNQLRTVYADAYSWRVEDVVTGGYVSVITQTVPNYTDPEIFFAWAAVLEGAHGLENAATVIIRLRDLTDGVDLITRQYNAASGGSGVDPRFNYDSSTNFFWTPWQVEQLMVPSGSAGHDVELTILASDCGPTAHAGYLYLDGFGATPPPPTGIPEPGTYALVGLGLGLASWKARKRKQA